MTSTPAVLPLLLLPACFVQEIDLRSPPSGDAAPIELPGADCGDAERRSGDTGACEACQPRPAAGEICPCGSVPAVEAPAGFCNDPAAAYACIEPCTGGIEQCTGYDPDSGIARDCGLLERCCDQQAGTGQACSQPDEILCCSAATGGRVTVVAAGCCAGPACTPGGGECDETWQDCVDGACTPACRPLTQYCDECGGCTCATVPP